MITPEPHRTTCSYSRTTWNRKLTIPKPSIFTHLSTSGSKEQEHALLKVDRGVSRKTRLKSLLPSSSAWPAGRQQASGCVPGRPVRGQSVHHQNRSGQPEAGSDRGHTLLSHQEAVWTQRHRRGASVGVPATGGMFFFKESNVSQPVGRHPRVGHEGCIDWVAA